MQGQFFQLSDYLTQVRNNINDQASANFSDPTLINFINQARNRVAMDTHCVRGFITGLSTIVQQEQYPMNGFVGGYVVNVAGRNYTNPVVTVSGGSGTGATAQAILGNNGSINSVVPTSWGQNYAFGDNVTAVITDPTGTGAVVTPVMSGVIIDVLSVTVIWPGNTMAVMDGFMPFTMFQAFARAYRSLFDYPRVFTIHQGIQKVFLQPVPDQNYPMEWDIITTPANLVNTTDTDTQVIPPWNDAVQLFACHLAMMSLQNPDMADWFYSGDPRNPGKYDLRVRQLPATAFSRRIANPYTAFRSRISRM